MPVPSLLLPFLLVVALLTVTPGPDMVLVLRNGAGGGSTAAWRTGLGCCTGIAAHACAAVLGLSALLAASEAAYTVVKLAGAAYLIWLGASALWRSRRVPRPEPESVAAPAGGAPAAPRAHVGSYYRQGLLTNLLNPKIALLFLTLLPQFVAAGEPRVATTAKLAVVFLLIAVLWWRLFSLAVGRLGAVMSRPRVRAGLDRVTGLVLVGLGIRVALQHP
jgi:threonine/homoserine/homoserine lactone efflux protein